MKRAWFYSVLAAVVVIAVVVTSCQPTPAPTTPSKATEPPKATPTPTPALTSPPPAERKIMTIIFTQEPATLNPLYSNMWFEAILQQLWSCWAWEFDNQNTAFPRLVTEIPSTENGGISEDGLTITMHLRDDIVWSDGTPITSADFVFTYDMYMDPGNSVATQYPYDSLESIEAPDERTVVMHFTKPFAPWQALFWRGVLPKHVLEPVFETKGSIDQADWNLAPTVGCGPFKFAEWESGSFMRFVKNENYWLGQPKLDEIFIRFVPDDASQTAALVAGDADLGTFPPLSDVPALQDAGLKIVVQPSGYQEGWFFNFRDMAHPAVKDVRVRQAIAMAIDRDAINRDLLLGLTKAPETYWDSLPEYRAPDIEPWKYNPEEAKRLLEEAGWIDRDGDGIREDAEGNKLTLKHGTTIREIRQDAQAVAQQQLKEVGIDLQIMSQNADLFFGSYADGASPAVGELDIMEWSDGPYFPDPDTDYWLCSQVPSEENPTGYNYFGCDKTLDELFTRQLTIMNAEERQQVFHEISRYMHDQVYWLGMWEDPDYWIVGSRLSGIKFSGVTPFYNVMEWDLQK
ncbi:MAG: peptide ABC transporter substrate-binding protein [Anaerolineae bacterium]|jgi:peptide/nickel transport system substrate-binding protein|nr:peptide ABC transporter substrate-binding protein [Anaerolineae bacterium]MDH7474101.1 peptide ABC transporter substrate-binding protein [Anaerolineae bacterium]